MRSSLIYNISLIGIDCTIDIRDLIYRGISITWRRLLSTKSDIIHIEIIITLALSDKSFHLCDSHHNKPYYIGSDFGIECLDSWDNCLSWPFNSLSIECHSKSHEYPKSIIFNQINLSIPSTSNSKNIFYQFQYPSSNYSCCWQDFDFSNNPVQLISHFNLFNLNEINSPPIARFPEHIYIDLYKDFIYSLEIFDPDGDLFQCKSSVLISSIIINENCLITIKANSIINYNEILLKIEIIEYKNNKKDEIRSRLPYHIIGFIDYHNTTEQCSQLPSIHLLNIENNLVHVAFNQSVQVHLISKQNQIQIEFEWIPKTIQQCGYHIRCFDQLTNYNDKCIHIFVNGPICHNITNIHESCSWSPFSIWIKNNQTTYRRSRTCYEINNHKKICLFCYGSSIQYQSSLAFTKDFELFEQSLLSPTRAHSRTKIIYIITIIWIITFRIAISISIYFGGWYFRIETTFRRTKTA